MLDRQLLAGIGFEIGSGWDHEVWVYDGYFWVHYGGEFGGLEGQQIDGNTATNKEFFAMFLEAVRKEIMDSAIVMF